MIIMLFAVRYSFPPVSVEPSIAPHPKSYMEVNCCLAVHIPPLRHPSMHTPTTFFRHEATSECLLVIFCLAYKDGFSTNQKMILMDL